MSLSLLIEDYQNLLIMAQGKNPLWDWQSLHRCVTAGLVNKRGDFLTREGRRKAERLQKTVEKMQAGLSFSKRPVNRADELSTMTWRRAFWGEKRIWFNSHALFNGFAPDNIYSNRTDISASEYSWIDREIKNAIHTPQVQLVKLIPVAVQLDTIGGLEVVMFKLTYSKGASSKYLRMQTKYYDFIKVTWKGISFWCHPKRPDSPIIVKNSFGPGFKNKIHALVLPVAGTWLDPIIDDSQIDTAEEESENVQEEEEKKLSISGVKFGR